MSRDDLTLGKALATSAGRYPDRVAIADGDMRVSFRDLDRNATALALGLRELGVQRGDQVAVSLANGWEWVVCWMACARAGAVMVPINTRYKPEEVEYILRQSDARVFILMDAQWGIDYLELARQIIPELLGAEPGALKSASLPALTAVVLWKDVRSPGALNLQGLLKRGEALAAEGAVLSAEDPADPVIIVYTSGTTGFPKGAMHNHVILRNAANLAREMHIEAGDVILGHMPYYSIAGSVMQVGMSVLIGCTLVPLAHWSGEKALELVEREKISVYGGIPTHFVDSLDALRARPRNLGSLKTAWIGGAPVTPEIASASLKELGLKSLHSSYGMTETTGCTTTSEFGAPLEIVCDNKGKPIGDFEVGIFDPVSGTRLPTGKEGEIWVRGHIVMMGYYKNEKGTAEVLRPDGWFRTGDLGTFDEAGYLKPTARLKEMFIVGGSNAYPAEIERVLQSHPMVKQAVIVGTPHPRLGEVGTAFIQLHDGAQVQGEELIAYCRERLADFKVPREVNFVPDFPRTSTGKIQRFVLADEAKAATRSVAGAA
jgi:fatty-acyl-CoA synthase